MQKEQRAESKEQNVSAPSAVPPYALCPTLFNRAASA
jgi:hypothetical protein